ncbi:MAG: Fpg/Nei family DNA glycosylase [Thiobacillaceae bacterium]
MPEGDSVHKLAAYLSPLLTGRRLTLARIRNHPDAQLAGHRVIGVGAHGKHLFIQLDDGRVLRSHLGMRGSWHHYRADEAWAGPAARAAIELQVGDEVLVCFNPKEVALDRAGGPGQRPLPAHLGPDLLAADVNADRLVERARTLLDADTPLADVLLDQRVAAGIGNVYKSETLFLMGIPPWQTLAQTPDETLRATFVEAARLLRANTRPGPRVTRRSADATGILWVYGRKGQPCHRCGSTIRHARLGRHLRATYWCPRCQAEAADGRTPGA